MTEPTLDAERLPPVAAVLLARLLVPAGRSPPKLATYRKDVAAVVGEIDDVGWAAAVSTLTAGGFAVAAERVAEPARRKPVVLHLTDAGRTAARDRLGRLADAPRLPATKVAAFWQFDDPRRTAPAVLLTRLYVPDAVPPTDAALRKFVAAVVGPLDDAAWDAAKATLESAGHTNAPTPPSPPARPPAVDPLPLTDAGRHAALAWLHMPAVPPGLTWAAVQADWLPDPSPPTVASPVASPVEDR